MLFRLQSHIRLAVLAAGCVCTAAFSAPDASAATLEQLTLDQMAQKATAVVRATVAGSYTGVTNATVYTHYTLRVSETWKGASAPEVMLPGGISGKFQQSFPGVPELKT